MIRFFGRNLFFAVVICCALAVDAVAASMFPAAPTVVSIPGGSAPADVALIDVGGDGAPDLVVTDRYSYFFFVAQNSGSGSFPSGFAKSYAFGGWSVRSIIGGRFNQDAFVDVAVSNANQNRVTLLYGDGAGGFPSLPIGPFPSSSAALAVNVVPYTTLSPAAAVSTLTSTNFNGTTVTVRLQYLSTNDVYVTPTVGVSSPYTVGSNPVAVVASDVNNDGHPDLLTANANGKSISVLISNPGGYSVASFPVILAAQQSFVPSASPQSLSMVDVDNDGNVDAVVTIGGKYLSVLLGDGVGGFGSPLLIPTNGTGSDPVRIGDVNGDGKQDLIKADNTGSQYMLWLGDGSGVFSRPTLASLTAGGVPIDLYAVDFDQDGHVDLLAVDSTGNRLDVWRGSAAEFRGVTTYGVGTNPVSVAPADMNGDGRLDFLVLNADSYSVSVLLNNGNGGLSAATNYPTMTGQQISAHSSAKPSALAVADFNRDGRSDVMVSHFGSAVLSLLVGNGSGGVASPILVNDSTGGGAGGSRVQAADMNGDTIPDVAVADAAGGFLVLFNDGTGSFGIPARFSSGLLGSTLAVDDLNGDGLPDVATASPIYTDVYVQIHQATYDTVAPSGSVQIAGGASAVNHTSVSVDGFCSDNSGGVGCAWAQISYDNGASWSSWQQYTTAANPLVSIPWTMPSGDGTKTVQMRFADAMGNVSSVVSASVLLDTVAPGAPVITSPANGTGNQQSPVISGTAEPYANVQVYDSHVALGNPVTASANGGWTLTLPAPLSAGSHLFSAIATDAAGNSSTESTAVNYTIDTTPPLITLSGPSTISLTWGGSAFVDPGATVRDDFDTGLVATVTYTLGGQVKSGVDVYTAGTYTLTYNATDHAGNAAAPVTRTVIVKDVTPPVITLNGGSPYTVAQGQAYIDPGATISDNVDTGLTATVTGSVNTNIPGNYTLTYTASDSAGNQAVPVTRVVRVVDQTPPVITLNGANPYPVNLGSTFVDPGSVVTDNVDSGLVATVSGTVNTAVAGSYTLTYTASDSAGNSSTATRTVIVGDSTPPVITLQGNNPLIWPLGIPFVDPGSNAVDAVDGVLTVTVGGSVNTSVVGSYTLTYSATDSSGNQSTVTRTVKVQDLTPPVITLLGANPYTVAQGSGFVDPGATVSDNVDGGLTPTVSGNVNVAQVGSYTLTYTSVDSAGNRSTKTRTVLVVDQTPPVITLNGSDPYIVPQGGHFVDPGAVVSDNVDQNLVATVTGNVDTLTVGSYLLTYQAKDHAGNQAQSVTRTVKVQDLTPPVITLLGANPYTVALGGSFADPGSTVSDNVDTGLSATVSGSVNTMVPGTYVLQYSASDAAGNGTTVNRMVIVADQTPPVITLLGANPYTIPVGTTFVDPGASVQDNYSSGLQPVVTGTVDSMHPGQYTVSYDATDHAGNRAATVTRTVRVVDTEPPVIQLTGSSNMVVALGGQFADPGAVVHDNYSQGLVATVAGAVDSSKPGSYVLTYSAVDEAGNQAIPVNRTVQVVDQTPPVISLSGAQSMTIAQGSVFNDPGVTVSDNYSVGLVASVSGRVDTNLVGSYTLQYDAYDEAGNAAVSVYRVVNVTDQTAPVIQLQGSATMNVDVGLPFTDPGVVVVDNVDTNLSAVVSGQVNTAVLGDYSLTYTARDQAGNTASPVVRVVHVLDRQPPTITLVGASVITIPVGGVFTDPGSIVTDNVDVGLIASTTGTIDTATVGQYTLSYTAVDSSGNSATPVSRTIKVVDTTPPVVVLNGADVINISLGSSFVDPGATVTDNVDTALSVNVVGSVNTSVAGQYLLHYGAVDSAGNAATEVVRVVNVVDHTTAVVDHSPPVVVPPSDITVEATASLTPVALGNAVVTDNIDTGLVGRPSTSGPFSVGTHSVTWTATDASGNTGSAVQTVIVTDTTPPVITQSGSATVHVPQGGKYMDPGFQALDAVDGDLTAQTSWTLTDSYGAVFAQGTGGAISIAMTRTGIYSLAVQVHDASGNTSSKVIRTVNVLPSLTVRYPLSGGWNLVSFPMDLGANSLAYFSSEVTRAGGRLDSIWEWNGKTWNSFVSGVPVALNSVTALRPGVAYWVKLADHRPGPATLTINLTGFPVPASTPGWVRGWTLMGVDQDVGSIGTFLSNNGLDSVWTVEHGHWQSFLLNVPGYLNSLQQLKVGVGYYVHKP